MPDLKTGYPRNLVIALLTQAVEIVPRLSRLRDGSGDNEGPNRGTREPGKPMGLFPNLKRPLLNSQRCKLLGNDRLANQPTNLERRVGRGTGRDSIDHPPGAHDDLAKAAAGVISSGGG
jgi:hypothetical protein